MSENTLYIRIIEVLKKEVVYATGCTEPIALAYAAATARKYLESEPTEIAAFVSPNLMKNGMAVKVPGTGLPGMDIAVAPSCRHRSAALCRSLSYRGCTLGSRHYPRTTYKHCPH